MGKSLVMILFFFTIGLFAQNTPEKEFEKALVFYSASRYQDAGKIFKTLSSNQSFSNHKAATILYAKSLYSLYEYEQAIRILQKFAIENPRSTYIPEARRTIIASAIALADFELALDELLFLYESVSTESNPTISEQIERLAFHKIDNNLLKQKSRNYPRPQFRPLLRLIYAKVLLRRGEMEEANNEFSQILSIFPGTPESLVAEALQSPAEQPNSQVLRGSIVALIPLDSPDKHSAQSEILEGIKIAINEYNSLALEKIGLIIKDSRRSEAGLRSVYSELVGRENILGIIGPLFSDETKLAAGIFENLNIPLISPTATDNELNDKKSNLFQANPSFENRCKIIAEYIFGELGKRKVAIFYDESGYGPSNAHCFKQAFTELGGTVVLDRGYSISGVNLNNVLAEVKELTEQPDVIYFPVVASSNTPAILAAVRFNGITIDCIGDQDWIRPFGYEDFTDVLLNFRFFSDNYVDYNDPKFIKLERYYEDITGHHFSKFMLYGYDATAYLLALYNDNANINPSDVIDKMKSGYRFTGLKSNIHFTVKRVNNSLNLLRYRSNKFELIDRIDGRE